MVLGWRPTVTRARSCRPLLVAVSRRIPAPTHLPAETPPSLPSYFLGECLRAARGGAACRRACLAAIERLSLARW
eukprot:scaffold213616_cov39-Tisochrysis_lutea.AAC.3